MNDSIVLPHRPNSAPLVAIFVFSFPLIRPQAGTCIIRCLVPLGTNFTENFIGIETFSLRKCIWKGRLRNVGQFVSASNYQSLYSTLLWLSRHCGIFFSRQNFFDGALVGFEARVDAWADSLFTLYCRKFGSSFLERLANMIIGLSPCASSMSIVEA